MSGWVTRHIGVVVRRAPELVYALAADPDLLPRWAAGLAAGPVRHQGGALVVDSPMGEVRVRFVGRNDLGVLDHEVELPDGTVVHNPLRVLPHPDGAEVIFTLRTRVVAGGSGGTGEAGSAHPSNGGAGDSAEERVGTGDLIDDDDDEARRDADAVAADLERLKALAESTPPGAAPLHAGRTPPESAPAVRLAKPADAATLGQLLYEFNTEFEAATPDARSAAARFERMLSGDEVVVVVAPSPVPTSPAGDATGGFALITFRPSPYQDGPVALLDELYVRPELRGRGIGAAMMDLATDEMRARGCVECLINVDADDSAARRFYERLGWSHLDPDSGSPMLCYLREL